MPASYTFGQSLNPLGHPAFWASLQWRHTFSITPAMEPRHLLHTAFTCPPNGNARRLKSRHPFAPVAQLICSFDDNNLSAVICADHKWNADRLKNTTWLPTFITVAGSHIPGTVLPRTVWVGFNRLCTGICCFQCCLHKWVWSHMRPVSVAQKNRPFTMLMCSTITSTVLPMACTAWWFRMTRKSIGCSKLVTRSWKAYQWIHTTAHTLKKKFQSNQLPLFGWNSETPLSIFWLWCGTMKTLLNLTRIM